MKSKEGYTDYPNMRHTIPHCKTFGMLLDDSLEIMDDYESRLKFEKEGREKAEKKLGEIESAVDEGIEVLEKIINSNISSTVEQGRLELLKEIKSLIG
jgi:hypothetical protein